MNIPRRKKPSGIFNVSIRVLDCCWMMLYVAALWNALEISRSKMGNVQVKRLKMDTNKWEMGHQHQLGAQFAGHMFSLMGICGFADS